MRNIAEYNIIKNVILKFNSKNILTAKIYSASNVKLYFFIIKNGKMNKKFFEDLNPSEYAIDLC